EEWTLYSIFLLRETSGSSATEFAAHYQSAGAPTIRIAIIVGPASNLTEAEATVERDGSSVGFIHLEEQRRHTVTMHSEKHRIHQLTAKAV
ncbi:hypothetical protein R0K18_28470, partial [Pantoea sp. SIMBA_133]